MDKWRWNFVLALLLIQTIVVCAAAYRWSTGSWPWMQVQERLTSKAVQTTVSVGPEFNLKQPVHLQVNPVHWPPDYSPIPDKTYTAKLSMCISHSSGTRCQCWDMDNQPVAHLSTNYCFSVLKGKPRWRRGWNDDPRYVWDGNVIIGGKDMPGEGFPPDFIPPPPNN